MEEAPWGSGHSTKADRFQEMFGQCSQDGVILGISCAEILLGPI